MRIFRQKFKVALAMSFVVSAVPVKSAQLDSAWFAGGYPTPLAQQAVSILKKAGNDGLQPDKYLINVLGRTVQNPAPIIDPVHETTLASAFSKAILQYLTDLRFGSADGVPDGFKPSGDKNFSTRQILQNAISQYNLQTAVDAVRPNVSLYTDLSLALLRYKELANTPIWDKRLPPVKKGIAYEGMPQVIERLSALGDLPKRPAGTAYTPKELSQGISQFQERHGLSSTGSVDNNTIKQLSIDPAHRARQIELSMERLRWIPRSDSDRLIIVNIPEFKLYAFDAGAKKRTPVHEMNIIVGRAYETQTPLFTETMRLIEFSPFWNVPPSIQGAETVPKIKRNPAWFKQQGFEFVTPDGTVIPNLNKENLAAAENGYLRIRQKPGPQNPLGDIKFIFPNQENIYLHHTSTERLFSKKRRDFSHGCVRVEEPVVLAKFVLKDDPAWTENKIISAMDEGVSSTIKIKKPFPVALTYATAIVKDNGLVYFFEDIYKLDEKEWHMLDGKPRRPVIN